MSSQFNIPVADLDLMIDSPSKWSDFIQNVGWDEYPSQDIIDMFKRLKERLDEAEKK